MKTLVGLGWTQDDLCFVSEIWLPHTKVFIPTKFYTHPNILYPSPYFIPRPRVKLKKQSNYNVNVNPLYRSVETANPPFTRSTVFIQTFSKGSFSIKRKLRGSLPVSLRINLGFKKKVPYFQIGTSYWRLS